MDAIRLTGWQRRLLKRQLHKTTDARVYRRTLAILEASRGIPIADVAQTLGVSRQSVYRWIEQFFRVRDPQALIDASRSGRPSVWRDPLRSLLRSLMATTPEQLGYWASNWTVGLLQQHLEQAGGQRLSDESIRRELARLGYVWKRGRYVLAPDCEAETKTPYSPRNRAFADSERCAGRR